MESYKETIKVTFSFIKSGGCKVIYTFIVSNQTRDPWKYARIMMFSFASLVKRKEIELILFCIFETIIKIETKYVCRGQFSFDSFCGNNGNRINCVLFFWNHYKNWKQDNSEKIQFKTLLTFLSHRWHMRNAVFVVPQDTYIKRDYSTCLCKLFEIFLDSFVI